MKISGYINPCSSRNIKQDALSKIETALSRASKARKAENVNKIFKAFEWRNLLYNGYFSNYW